MILLSIHKKYADLILNGQKTLEIRKTFPKMWMPGPRVILYETKSSGNGEIVGEATLAGFEFAGNPEEMTKEQTKNACLTQEQLTTYAAGGKIWAWKLTNPTRYAEARALSECLGAGAHAPQSWRFVDGWRK